METTVNLRLEPNVNQQILTYYGEQSERSNSFVEVQCSI